jgi:peptide/nickel transport system substrate-binding protein
MLDKTLFPLILTAALAWMIPGCGPTESGGPQGTSDVDLAAIDDSSARNANARVTVGITQEFENMNPLISQMAASTYIFYFVGRPLVSVNEDWEYECWLCVEIPTLDNGLAAIVTEDGTEKLTAKWEIKPGASWGDGVPITARDVELSWKIGASPNVSVGSKETYTQIEAIEIDPENPRKFTLKFEKANYDHYQLATFFLLPSHIEGPIWEASQASKGAYEKQTAYTNDPTNRGLYSGPYRVAEIKLGSHVSLVRNDAFYGSRPNIDEFIIKLIPNTQTLEANLISGNIDLISELGMTFDQALAFDKRARNDPDLQKFETRFRQGMIYEHIDLNLRNPILQDLRVRRALVYAIDRNELVTSLFEGEQKIALHNIHPLDPYYTDDVVRYPHDPQKAAALLEAAGWMMDASGYRYRNGEKLKLSLMTTAQNKTRELVEVFLQDQWKQIGIDITIKNEPARVFFGETVRKAKYPALAMFAWISSPDHPPRSVLHSEEIPTLENGWSGQNASGFKSDAIDAALDSIKTEFDFEKRKALMKVIQQEYAKEVPAIPLYLRAQIAVVPKQIRNYRLSGHQFYSTLRAEYWSMQ